MRANALGDVGLSPGPSVAPTRPRRHGQEVPRPAHGPGDGGGEVVHTVDLRDPAAVELALAAADRVLHLGAVPREAPPADLLQASVLGTHNVLEAARRTGTERVVPTSSNHVAGFYPASHLTGLLPDMPPIWHMPAPAMGRRP
ncbi:NAD-dependent epimerase/dehydratase family protein [Streptomyces canus]|uniref:NAD-dependent epimerase/dehydratase family protein n=1 Tax=Streptomyces canus TaxID=58343 RepID=UPI00324F9571